MTLIKAKVKKKKIIIGSWHGSNRGSDSLRKDVVKELRLYMGTISGNPWIVGGDFTTLSTVKLRMIYLKILK